MPKSSWRRLRSSSGDYLLGAVCDGQLNIIDLDHAGLSPRSIADFAHGHVGLEGLLSVITRPLDDSLPTLRTFGNSADVKPCPPFVRPGKFLALGRTFPAHAAELGHQVPKEPLVFLKLPENICADGDDLVLHHEEGERFDNEVEVGLLLGRDLWEGSPGEAREAIAGWFLVNDFTCRSAQGRAKKSGGPWFLAKNPPGALPLGSFLVPPEHLPDPRSLSFSCEINGAVAQEGCFSGMSQAPWELLAWLSGRIPLHAGDLVALGTPRGVSTVAPGDRLLISVPGLGILRHRVRTAEGGE